MDARMDAQEQEGCIEICKEAQDSIDWNGVLGNMRMDCCVPYL